MLTNDTKHTKSKQRKHVNQSTTRLSDDFTKTYTRSRRQNRHDCECIAATTGSN